MLFDSDITFNTKFNKFFHERFFVTLKPYIERHAAAKTNVKHMLQLHDQLDRSLYELRANIYDNSVP